MVALAAVAAVLFLVGRGDDERPPAESTAAPTTTEFVVVTAPPAQGFQTPVEADGVQITPTQPVSAFGTTCVIWELAGAAPLSFDPAAAQLIAGGTTFVDVPATRSGRVAGGPIDPAATTASAETCFAGRRRGAVELRGRAALHTAGRRGLDPVPVDRHHAVSVTALYPGR